jgi:hypothetical protein
MITLLVKSEERHTLCLFPTWSTSIGKKSQFEPHRHTQVICSQKEKAVCRLLIQANQQRAS